MTTSRPQMSQWRAQLGALGLDGETQGTADARAEAALIEGVRLPPLALAQEPGAEAPLTRRAPRSGTTPLPLPRFEAALLALAAALAVILAQPRASDLVVKGGTHVAVFWERRGEVHALGDGGPLADGDRVRAEIEPGTAGTAYWVVADRGGRALVDADFVLKSALPLVAHRRAAFAQSLRLVGEAEGESLSVIVCDGAALDEASVRAAVTAEGAPLALARLPSRCRVAAFPLR